MKLVYDWIEEHCKGVDEESFRRIEYLKESGVGTWLVTMPSIVWDTTLFPTEFWDKIRSRYGFAFLKIETHCDRYGARFTSSRALSYKVGGLIHMRYDKSRYAIGILVSQDKRIHS